MQLKNVSSVTAPWSWGLHSAKGIIISPWKTPRINTTLVMQHLLQHKLPRWWVGEPEKTHGRCWTPYPRYLNSHLHDTFSWSPTSYLCWKIFSPAVRKLRSLQVQKIRSRRSILLFAEKEKGPWYTYEWDYFLFVGMGWFRMPTPVLDRSLHCWLNTSKLCTRLFCAFPYIGSPHRPSHQKSLQVIFPAQVSLQVPANCPALGRIPAGIMEETSLSLYPQWTSPNNVKIGTNELLKEPHWEMCCQSFAALRRGLGGTAGGKHWQRFNICLVFKLQGTKRILLSSAAIRYLANTKDTAIASSKLWHLRFLIFLLFHEA